VIPVIDLSGFVSGSGARRAAVGAEIDRACREVGFFSVVGHGVDADVIDDLHRLALAFFDLPLPERLAVAMPVPGYPYGYSALRAEALNGSLGGDAPPDLKETFNVGPIDPPPRPLEEMEDPDERAVYAPNLWPAAIPGLRPAVESYYRSMAVLSATLMEAFAVALDLPADTFAGYIDRHGSALRLAHYPDLGARPPSDGYRAGAHTDYGTLTVLWTDGHRRPAGRGARRHVDRRGTGRRRPRREPGRPDAAVDERPLAFDDAPRRCRRAVVADCPSRSSTTRTGTPVSSASSPTEHRRGIRRSPPVAT
jgi:isopenicillin N synthase-like dioxygenase